MVVLDTDILVDFLRNDDRAISGIKKFYDSGTPVFTTSVTVFELFRGAYASHKSEKNLRDVEMLIKNIDLLSFDVSASRIAGRAYNDLEKEGKMIGILDMYIGCIVISNNEILITRNVGEFSRIKGLKIEKW